MKKKKPAKTEKPNPNFVTEIVSVTIDYSDTIESIIRKLKKFPDKSTLSNIDTDVDFEDEDDSDVDTTPLLLKFSHTRPKNEEEKEKDKDIAIIKKLVLKYGFDLTEISKHLTQ